MMEDLPFHEVYATRCSRIMKLGRDNLLFCPEPLASQAMPMDYSLWAIRSPARTFVVDTGYSREQRVFKIVGGDHAAAVVAL